MASIRDLNQSMFANTPMTPGKLVLMNAEGLFFVSGKKTIFLSLLIASLAYCKHTVEDWIFGENTMPLYTP